MAFPGTNGRNTSTDVEKTWRFDRQGRHHEKHLHGRGEDFAREGPREAVQETPPRTWRRPGAHAGSATTDGNTSTDVEKTAPASTSQRLPRKHLHGRGEDEFQHLLAELELETPPRTWRRRCWRLGGNLVGRNTSTDVEKTDKSRLTDLRAGKHLHGRGEDP